jgi:hypothetical protein
VRKKEEDGFKIEDRNSRLATSWWARLDSNQEPTDYESAALTVELRARLQNILQIRAARDLSAAINLPA